MAAHPKQLLMEAGIKFVNGPYTVNPVRLFIGTLLMKVSARLLNCKIEIVLNDPVPAPPTTTSGAGERPTRKQQLRRVASKGHPSVLGRTPAIHNAPCHRVWRYGNAKASAVNGKVKSN